MGQLIRGFESHPLRHYSLKFFNFLEISFLEILRLSCFSKYQLYKISSSNNNNSLNLSHAVAITSYKLNEFLVKNKKNTIDQKKLLKDQSSKKEIKNFLNFLILNLDKNI